MPSNATNPGVRPAPLGTSTSSQGTGPGRPPASNRSENSLDSLLGLPSAPASESPSGAKRLKRIVPRSSPENPLGLPGWLQQSFPQVHFWLQAQAAIPHPDEWGSGLDPENAWLVPITPSEASQPPYLVLAEIPMDQRPEILSKWDALDPVTGRLIASMFVTRTPFHLRKEQFFQIHLGAALHGDATRFQLPPVDLFE